MYFAARQHVKLRLVVVLLLVLVATATGRCGWAGGVKASAEPRFGVEGERHRMVLPLTAFPSEDPWVHSAGATVDVTLKDLRVSAADSYMPNVLSTSAEAIRDVVIQAGKVSLRARRDVQQARAFLLADPPRLVVDLHLASSVADHAGGSVRTGGSGEGGPDGVGGVISQTARTPKPADSAASPTSPPASEEKRPEPEASWPDQQYRLGDVNGRPMIWPDLDASFYAHADTAAATAKFITPRRDEILRRRMGRPAHGVVTAGISDRKGSPEETGPRFLPAHTPAAAHFLTADIEYLEAAAGEGSFFSAIALYRRAVRMAPDFPDGDRGRLMIGFAQLAMGFGTDAASTFAQLCRAARNPSVGSLACLGAGRGSWMARNNDLGASFFRSAIVSGGLSDGACRARGDLGVILAETRRASEALNLFNEMLMLCPAYLVRAPKTLLDRAGVLAAAGHANAAEQLLLALPEFEGDLFIRRKFLEGELAIAVEAPESARRAYEAIRVYGQAPAETRAEAVLRLAQLEDRAGQHERAGVLLGDLAVENQPPTLRAKALATAARLLAQSGGYPEALGLLERADGLGPAGLAAAEDVRAWLFPTWITSLAEKKDNAGILAVFYGYRGDGVASHLTADGTVRVASAAADLGLPELAVQILSPVHDRARGAARVEARRILAQAALARGDDEEVVRLTGETERSADKGGPQAAVVRIRAAALLRLGRLDEAAELLQFLGTREDLVALGTAYLQIKNDADKAYSVLRSALAGTEEGVAETSGTVLAGWLAMADAAGRAGNHTLAAAALRTAIRLFPNQATAGMHYQLARFESVGAGTERAAETYATAAKMENDPLLARVAAADAAYYRALHRRERGE